RTRPASARPQRAAGDLARREEADLLPGEAEAAVHVQGRIAVPVEAAVEGADELRQVAGPAPGPGERELAAVRVAGEHQRGAEAGRPRGRGGAGGEGEERGGRGGGGARAFTRSTCSQSSLRPRCAPTCRSERWTMRRPSSADGSPRTGTSRWETASWRRPKV